MGRKKSERLEDAQATTAPWDLTDIQQALHDVQNASSFQAMHTGLSELIEATHALHEQADEALSELEDPG